jgi:hypothetical protein
MFLCATVACLVAAGCSGDGRPLQPTPVCSVTVDPPVRTFSDQGGTASINVSTTAANCPWSTRVDAAWVNISSGASGQESGVLTYTVAANVSPDPRTAVIDINGASHVIQQAGQTPTPECRYVIDKSDASFDTDGGDGRVAVSATEGCEWTAASNASWVVLTSNPRNTGNGEVSYSVKPNFDPTSRTATITIATVMLTVRQAGASTTSCQYRVTPVAFNPCMPAGTIQARLETGAVCQWSSSTDTPWLNITSPTSGRGPAEIQVSFSANYDAPREGLVKVRWPAPTAGQNLRISQAGCRYSVTKTVIDMPAAGGSTTFDVVQQSDPTVCGGPKQNACVWSAVSDAGWVVVTTPMPQMGDGPVTVSVAANSGGSARSATIRLRDLTVRINQAGG